MLNPLQKWLTENNGDLDRLAKEFGLTITRHPSLPLLAFKYDQLESPKTHEVVRHSRGTVLEDKTWNLVAMPFVRFFNYGEHEEEGRKFNWNNFSATTKEDGSLIIVYHYAGEWHVNTSGSFGYGILNFSGKTWREHFWTAFDKTGNRSALKQDSTYIFEFCSMDNQVVRLYKEPNVFFLGMTTNGIELTTEEVDKVAVDLKIQRPMSYTFKNIDDVLVFLNDMEEKDKTFEGVVIRDDTNIRFKVKSKTYLALHHTADNGNIAHPKHLVNFALAGEGDELIATFPYVKDRFIAVKEKLDANYMDLQTMWNESKGIENQKDFALKIKACKFSGLLFMLRKNFGSGLGELKDLKHMWRESGDTILKRLEF